MDEIALPVLNHTDAGLGGYDEKTTRHSLNLGASVRALGQSWGVEGCARPPTRTNTHTHTYARRLVETIYDAHARSLAQGRSRKGARHLNPRCLTPFHSTAEASYCISSTSSSAWTCPTCDSGVTVEAVVENNGGRALVGFDSGQSALFVALA